MAAPSIDSQFRVLAGGITPQRSSTNAYSPFVDPTTGTAMNDTATVSGAGITDPILMDRLLKWANSPTNGLTEDQRMAFTYLITHGSFLDESAVQFATDACRTLLQPATITQIGLSADDVVGISRLLDRPNVTPDLSDITRLFREESMAKNGYTPQELRFREGLGMVSPGDSDIQRMVAELQASGALWVGMADAEIAKVVDAYVKANFKYISDGVTIEGKPADHWNSVKETVMAGGGDCEDLSVLSASLLMAALKKNGYSDKDVREKVTVSAGYLVDSRDAFKGHVLVKFRLSSGDTLAMDATSGKAPVAFQSIKMDMVFEGNDVTFKEYQPIDAMFTTALNILHGDDNIVSRIQSAFEALKSKLAENVTVPIPSADGSTYTYYDPISKTMKNIDTALGHNIADTNGAVPPKDTADFGFFQLQKVKIQSDGGAWHTDMYVAKFHSEYFYEYIAYTRDMLNQIVMLFNLANMVMEYEHNQAEEIFVSGYEEHEKAEILESVDSTGKYKSRFINALNNSIQKISSGVDTVLSEMFLFVGNNNSAQETRVSTEIQMFGRENIATGIFAGIVDELTGTFSHIRTTAQLSLNSQMAKVNLDNASNYAKYARYFTQNVSLWDSGRTKEDPQAPDNQRAPDDYSSPNSFFYIGGGATDVATQIKSRKDTILKAFDVATDQMAKLSDRFNDLSPRIPSLNIDVTDSNSKSIDQAHFLGRSGDDGQFVELSYNFISGLRDYMVRFQNLVRSSYVTLEAENNAKRQVADQISGSSGNQASAKSTASTSQLKSAINNALGAELGRQLSGVLQMELSGRTLVQVSNKYIQSRFEYVRWVKDEVLRLTNLVAQVAIQLTSTIMGPIWAGSISAAASPAFILALDAGGPAVYNNLLADFFTHAVPDAATGILNLALESVRMGFEYGLKENNTNLMLQEGGAENPFSTDANSTQLLLAKSKAEVGPDLSKVYSKSTATYYQNQMEMLLYETRQQYDDSGGSETIKNSTIGTYHLTSVNDETMRETAFIGDRGDGKVYLQGYAMASNQPRAYANLTKITIFMLTLKAIEDAMEQVVATMFGKSKSGLVSSFDSQIDTVVGKENSLLNAYRSENNSRVETINTQWTKAHKQYSATAAFTLAGIKSVMMTARALSEAYVLIPIPWAEYGFFTGYSIQDTAIGIANHALTIADFMNTYYGNFGSLNINYNKNDSNAPVDGSFKSMLSEASATPASTYDLSNSVSSLSASLKQNYKVSLPNDHMVRQLAAYAGMDLKERVSLDIISHTENMMANQYDMVGLAGDFKQVDYEKMMKEFANLVRYVQIRTFLTMIDQAEYNAKQNALRAMFGGNAAGGFGEWSMIAGAIDRYSTSIVGNMTGDNGMFQDLTNEVSNNVTAINDRTSGALQLTLAMSLEAATILLDILPGLRGYTKAVKDTRNAGLSNDTWTALMKRFLGKLATPQMAQGLAKIALGAVMMSTVRVNNPQFTSQILNLGEEDYPTESTTDANREAAKESKNSSNNQYANKNFNVGDGDITTKGGRQRVDPSAQERATRSVNRNFRSLQVYSDIRLAMSDAKQDMAEDMGGGQSAKNAYRAMNTILTQQQNAENKAVEMIYSALRASTEAYNRGFDMVMDGATTVTSAAASSAAGVMRENADYKQKKAEAVGSGTQSTSKTSESSSAKKSGGGGTQSTSKTSESSSAKKSGGAANADMSSRDSKSVSQKSTMSAAQLRLMANLLDFATPMLATIIVESMLYAFDGTSDNVYSGYGKPTGLNKGEMVTNKDTYYQDGSKESGKEGTNQKDGGSVMQGSVGFMETDQLENAMFANTLVRNQQQYIGESVQDAAAIYDRIGKAYADKLKAFVIGQAQKSIVQKRDDDKNKALVQLVNSHTERGLEAKIKERAEAMQVNRSGMKSWAGGDHEDQVILDAVGKANIQLADQVKGATPAQTLENASKVTPQQVYALAANILRAQAAKVDGDKADAMAQKKGQNEVNHNTVGSDLLQSAKKAQTMLGDIVDAGPVPNATGQEKEIFESTKKLKNDVDKLIAAGSGSKVLVQQLLKDSGMSDEHIATFMKSETVSMFSGKPKIFNAEGGYTQTFLTMSESGRREMLTQAFKRVGKDDDTTKDLATYMARVSTAKGFAEENEGLVQRHNGLVSDQITMLARLDTSDIKVTPPAVAARIDPPSGGGGGGSHGGGSGGGGPHDGGSSDFRLDQAPQILSAPSKVTSEIATSFVAGVMGTAIGNVISKLGSSQNDSAPEIRATPQGPTKSEQLSQQIDAHTKLLGGLTTALHESESSTGPTVNSSAAQRLADATAAVSQNHQEQTALSDRQSQLQEQLKEHDKADATRNSDFRTAESAQLKSLATAQTSQAAIVGEMGTLDASIKASTVNLAQAVSSLNGVDARIAVTQGQLTDTDGKIVAAQKRLQAGEMINRGIDARLAEIDARLTQTESRDAIPDTFEIRKLEASQQPFDIVGNKLVFRTDIGTSNQHEQNFKLSSWVLDKGQKELQASTPQDQSALAAREGARDRLAGLLGDGAINSVLNSKIVGSENVGKAKTSFFEKLNTLNEALAGTGLSVSNTSNPAQMRAMFNMLKDLSAIASDGNTQISSFLTKHKDVLTGDVGAAVQQQLLGQVFNSIASAKGADGGHDNVKMEVFANDISRLLAMNTTGNTAALGAIVRAGFDIAGSTNNVDLLHAFTDHAIKSATVREGQRSGTAARIGGTASEGVNKVLKMIDAAGASGSIDSIKAKIRKLNEAEKQELFDRISKRSSAGNKVAIDKFLSKGEKYAAIYREFNGVEGYVLPDKLAPLFETIVTKGTPAVQGLAPGERERLTAEKRRLEGQRHDTAKDRIELTGLTAQRDQLNEDLGGQLAAQKGLTATVQSLTQEVAGQRLQQNKLAGELEATGGEITKIQTDLSQLRDKKQAGDATHQATREALQSELNKVTAISAEKNEQGIKLKASQKTAELKLKLKDQQIKKELDAKAKKEETLKNDIARETAHIAQLTEQRNAAVASERAAAQQEVLKQTVQAVANSAISAALRNVPSSQTTGGGTEHVPVAPKIGPKLFPSPPLLQAKGDTMPVAPQMGPNPSPSTQLPQHTGDVSPQPEPTPNPNIKVAERLQQLILQQKGALSHLERIGNIHAIRELAAITKGTTLPTGLLDMSRSGLLEKSKQQELTALLADNDWNPKKVLGIKSRVNLLKGPSWTISGDKIQGRAIDLEKISKLNPEQRQALDQKITALLSTGRSTETPNSFRGKVNKLFWGGKKIPVTPNKNSFDGIQKILDGTYSADRITALQAKLVVGARSYDDYLETAKTFGTSATLTPLIDKLKESDAATQKEYNARLANFAQQFRERGLNKQDIATVYDRVILWFGDAADSKAVGEKFSDIFSSHRRGFDLKTSAVEFSDLADRVRGQSRFQDRGKLLADNYAKAVAGMNTSHNTLEAAGARAYGWKRTDAADKLAKERRFNAEVMMGIEAEFRSEIVDFLDRGQTADVRSMMAGALSNPAARAMVSGAIQLLAAEKDMYGSNRLDQLQRVMLPATDYDTSRGTDNHLAMMSEFSKAWVDATSKASPSAEMSGPQTTLRGGRSMTGGNAGFLNNPIKWMLGDGDELANSLASNFARQLPIIGWFYGADGGDQSPHFREMVRGKGDNIAQLDNIHSIERKLGRDAAKALLDMPADQLQAMVASLDEASVAKLVKNIGGERAKLLMTRIKNDENSTVVMDAQIAKLSSVIKSTPEPTSQSVGGAQTIEPTLNPLHQDSVPGSHAVTEVTEDNRAAFITMQGQTLLPELLRRAAGELRSIPTSQGSRVHPEISANGPISPSTSVRYTPESMTSARRLLEPLRGLDRFFKPTDPQTDSNMQANLKLLQDALSGSEMTAGVAQQLASQLRQGTPPGEPARDTTTTPNPLIPRGTEKFIAIQKLTEGMTLNGLTVTDSAGPDDSATHHATATQRVNALHEEITSVLGHTVTSDLGDAAPSIGKLAEYDSPAAAHLAIVAITNDLTIYLGVQKDLETQKYDRETVHLTKEQTRILDESIKELDRRTQDYSLKLKQRSHEIVSMAVSVVKGNASGGAVALAQMVGKLRQSGRDDVVTDIAHAIAKVQQNDTFLTFLDEQVSQAKAKSTGKISKDVQYLSEFADQIQKSTIPKQPESLKPDQEQLNQRTEQVLGRFERIRVLDRLASEFNATTNIENIQKVVTDPAVSNDIARLVAQGLALDAKSAGRFLAVLAQKNASLATDLFDQVTVELGRLNAGDDPRPLRADIDRVEKVLKAAAVPDQVYVQALQSIKPLKPFHNIATVEGRRAVSDLQTGRTTTSAMAARLAQRTPDQARDIVRHVGTADRQLGVALITDLVRLNPVHASATISGLASGLRPGQLEFNDLRALVAAANQEVTSPQFEASITDPKISDGLSGVKDHFTRELATIEKQIASNRTGAVLGLDTMAISEHIVNAGFSVVAEVAKGVSQWVPSSGSTGPLSEFRQSAWASNGMRAFLDPNLPAVDEGLRDKLTQLQTTVQTHVASVADFISHKLETLDQALLPATVTSISVDTANGRMAAVAQLTTEELNGLDSSIKPTVSMMSHIAKSIETPLKFLAEHLANCSSREMATMLRNPHTADQINRLLTTSPGLLTGTHVVGTILDLGTALESIAPTIGRTLVTSADADIQNAVTLHALTHPSTKALVERTAQQCLTEIEGQIREKFAVPAERQQLDDALANVETVRTGDVTTEAYRTAVTELNGLGLGVTAYNTVDTVRKNVGKWSQTLQRPTIDTLQQMAEVLGKGTIDTALKFNPTGYLTAVANSGERPENLDLQAHCTALKSVTDDGNPKNLAQALLNQLKAMGGTPPTELTTDQVVGVSLLAHSRDIVAAVMNHIASGPVTADEAMAVINGANQLRLDMATAIDDRAVTSLTTEGLHGASVNLLSANQVLTQRSQLTGDDINRLATIVETKQQKNELYATDAIALSRTIEVATGRSLGVPESLDGTTAVHHLADIYTQLSENPLLDPRGTAKGSIAKAFVSELCNLKKSDALFAASPELKAQLMNTLRLIGESKVKLTDLGRKLTPGQFEHFLNNLENLNLSGAERLQMRQHQAVLTETMGVLQNPRLVQSIAARDPQLLSDAISQTTTPETAAARVLDVAEALNDPEFNDPELTRAIIGDLRSRDISRNPQFWKTFLKEIADKSGAPHIPGLTPPVDQASVDQLGQRIADRQLKADFSDFAYESFSMRPSSEDVGAVAHSQLLTALLTPNSASLISSETYDGRRSELVGILNHPPAPSPHPLNSIVHVANGRLMLDHLSRSDQDSAEKLAALVASPHLSPSARELVANLPAVKIQLLSGLDRNECRETLGTVLPEGMGRIPGDPEPLRVTMPTRWILEQVPSVIPQANKASLTILLNQSPRLDRYAGAINANPEFPGILKEECRNKPLLDEALNSMLAIASPQTIETVVGKLMDEDTSKGLQILSHPQVLVGQRHRLEPVVRQLMDRYPGPTWDGAEGDLRDIVSMIRRNSNPREGVGTGLGTSTQSVREERQGDSVAQTLGKIIGKSELTRRAELQQLLQTSDTRDQLFRQLTDESNTMPFGPDRRAILETLRSLTAGTPDEIKMDIISANTRRFAIGEVAKKSKLDDRIIAAATHWEVAKGSSDSASHMLSLIVDDPMAARQMELSGRVVKRLTEGSNPPSVEFDRALATAWMSQSDDNAVSVIDQLKTNPDTLRSILADVYRDTAGIPPYPSKAATAYGAIVKQAIGYNKSLDSTKIANSGVPTDHVIAILHQTWQEDPLEFNGVMNRFLETPLGGTDSDKKFTKEQIDLYTGLIGQKQDYSFSHNGRRNVNVKVNATGHGLVHLIPDRSSSFRRLLSTPEVRQNPWTTVLFRAGQDQQKEILGDLKDKKIGVEVVRQLKENYAAAEGNRQIGTTTGNPFGVTQNQVDNLDTLLEKTDGYIGSGNIKKTQALVTQLRHQFPGINSGFGLASREKLTSLLANRLLYNDKALLAVTGPMTLMERLVTSRSPVSDIGADQVKTTMPVLKDAYERVSGVINNTSTSNDAVLSTIRDYIETASISRMVDAMLPQFKIGSALATAAKREELPGTRFGKAARMELMQRNVGLDTSKPVEKGSVEDYLRMYAATRSLPSIDEKDKANPVKVRQSETQWVKTAVDGLSQNGKCISDIFEGMSHYDQRLNPHQSVLQNAMIDHFSGDLGVQKLINAAITAQEHSTGSVDDKKERLVTDLLVIGMRIPKASGTQAWANAMLSAIGKGHDKRIDALREGSPDPTRISDVLFPKRQVLNLGDAIDLQAFHQALSQANRASEVLRLAETFIPS